MASKKRIHPYGFPLLNPSLPKRPALHHPDEQSTSFDSQNSSSLLSAHPSEHYHVIYTKYSDAPRHSSIEYDAQDSDVTYECTLGDPYFSGRRGHPCSSSSSSRGPDAEPYVHTRIAGSLNSSPVSSYITGDGYFSHDSCASFSSRKINSGRQKWSYIEDETPVCNAGSSSGEQSDNIFTESRRSGCSLSNTYTSVSTGISSSTSADSGVLPISRLYERTEEEALNSARILPIEQQRSYVLSSGRMSLEEEAKLGRRPPTIDEDFENYFSSLML